MKKEMEESDQEITTPLIFLMAWRNGISSNSSRGVIGEEYSLPGTITMDATSEPPFEETYKGLIESYIHQTPVHMITSDVVVGEQQALPTIDLSKLEVQGSKEGCMKEITRASMEWGFFQVVNHGISRQILELMREEQMKIFREPLHKKENCDIYMNLSPGCYRWGAPSATSLKQLSWSEAFHIPLRDIYQVGGDGGGAGLRSAMKQFSDSVFDLAQRLAKILAENLGQGSNYFEENCLPTSSILRMNRYPPCPKYAQIFGLMPHTDSDFLTILYQDQVGGLQLIKDGKWITVKPNPDALIINIGDLFQAWSNGVYKSVEHRVVTNEKVERFSTAYFFCPSLHAVIKSCMEPSVYRKFSYDEYRKQVKVDVEELGYKIGLARFLTSSD